MKQSDGSDGEAAPLSPQRWARVRALVEETLALPPEARPGFLDAACEGDDALRARAERLVAACERADTSWGFLAQPAGELVAPLLVAEESASGDAAGPREKLPDAFHAALADRYAVGSELGSGGMATVYVADDLKHRRRVALKVLDPRVGALLGVERFLAEIRVTAGLQHPNILQLFDSGEAGGLLYYVMPLVDGQTLRARLRRERQLPVDEAVRVARVIAGALDYAHRQGVVHRDLKPENILLQDGQPLVADFGISLAVSSAASSRVTAPRVSLGTPRYMSPEQAAFDPAVDGRSDVYSLACVLYELLAGAPPFAGETVAVVIGKVLGELPASVRTLRPSVPAHVDAALARALSKLPADRFATAREFADALALPEAAAAVGPRTGAAPWRRPARLALVAAAIVGSASAAWAALRRPDAPGEITQIAYRDLIDQSQLSAATLTPDGRALVYTGPAEAGSPIMVWRLDQRAGRVVTGTEGGYAPLVSPDGRRLLFSSVDDQNSTVSIDGVAATDAAKAWRYGNGAWVGDSAFVTGGPTRGLFRSDLRGGTPLALTRLDSTQGETRHLAPLLLPGARAVVFTVSKRTGPALALGSLAIASLDPGASAPPPHAALDVTARRAFAYVDGWLLYTRADGKAIMAVRLDVERRQTSGTPIPVLVDEGGNLDMASLADNGTLLYVRRPQANSAVLVDAAGEVRPGLASPEGPFMYPRLSPDGKRVAVQVTSATGNDVWLYDLATRTPTRLTTDGRALHPTWTPDGLRIVFMAGGRGLMVQPVDGSAPAQRIPGTERAFGPAVTPDGRSVVYQVQGEGGWSVWSAPLGGEGAARRLVDDSFSESMPAVSPDGRWLAYASSATGHNEVYARPYPGPGLAVQVSEGGGAEPAWSADGHQIYYRAHGALIAAALAMPALAVTSRRERFAGDFDATMPHRNYDVSSDGAAFLMIAPAVAGSPEAVVVLNWVSRLREQLAGEPR